MDSLLAMISLPLLKAPTCSLAGGKSQLMMFRTAQAYGVGVIFFKNWSSLKKKITKGLQKLVFR